MKTTSLWPILAFLAVCNTYSQEKSFQFNRLNTRKLTLKGVPASEIHTVSYAKIDEFINSEYTLLKNELEKAIADSISKNAVYNNTVDKFNDISIIKSKIIAFNNSCESFGKKVILLKEAQILASKHNLTDLFYSDNEINKKMKAGFLLLTLNLDDLKEHLTKILLKLDTKIKAPNMPKYVSTATFKEKLKSYRKNYLKDPDNEKDYILDNSSVAPEDLMGDFVVVNTYYILSTPTNGLLENQLVSKKTILKLGITTKKLQSNKEKTLIQNKLTEEMYLVDLSFIDNFSVKS